MYLYVAEHGNTFSFLTIRLLSLSRVSTINVAHCVLAQVYHSRYALPVERQRQSDACRVSPHWRSIECDISH